MRTWNEASAIAWINTGSSACIEGKTIFVKTSNGLCGIKGCSAASYLINHCGYRMVQTGDE